MEPCGGGEKTRLWKKPVCFGRRSFPLLLRQDEIVPTKALQPLRFGAAASVTGGK